MNETSRQSPQILEAAGSHGVQAAEKLLPLVPADEQGSGCFSQEQLLCARRINQLRGHREPVGPPTLRHAWDILHTTYPNDSAPRETGGSWI